MGLEEKSGFAEQVEWFLDALQHERGASPHTLSAYAGDLESAAQFFSETGLAGWGSLTNEALTRYEASLGPPLKSATLRRRVSSLRSLLKFLKRETGKPDCDLPSASCSRAPKRLPKALQAQDLADLLDAPDTATPHGLRDRALMELIYGAGLRVSEACALAVAELTLDSAALRVTGKRGKTRWVPLPALTLPWIERYLAESRPRLCRTPMAQVFLNAHGKPLSRSMAYRILEKHTRAAGIATSVGPHILRHTYAVHLIKGGADLRAVQELLGHASVNTTQVYTQLDMEEVRKKYADAHPRR